MRAALTCLAALAVAGCATGGPRVEPPATPPPRADRPTYAVGDKWIRNDGVWDLTQVHKDRYVFVGDRGREIHLSHDLVPYLWARKRSDVQWMFVTFADYSAPRLTWPLEVGTTGSSSASPTRRVASSSPPPGHRRSPSSSPSWATGSSPTILCKGSGARQT